MTAPSLAVLRSDGGSFSPDAVHPADWHRERQLNRKPRPTNRKAVIVALANKLARIAWATLRKEVKFDRSYPVAA
jgi:hypothetical protein